jgi:hypothetical protein
MELKNLIKVRRIAVLAVAANVLAALAIAFVLPGELRGLLPVFALTVPLLTTALLESVAEKRLGRDALAV